MTPEPAPLAPAHGSLAARARGVLGLGRLLPRRLSTRVILGTGLLVAVGTIASAQFQIQVFEREILAEKIASADDLSRSITTSTRHLMRANRKDDAYAVVRTVGEASGVLGIRIYDREGRVAFRTDAGGTPRVGLEAPVCQVCHAVSPPRDLMAASERIRFGVRSVGARTMAIVTPIPNEPGCSTAACHVRDRDRRVLGVLDLSLDLAHVDVELADLRQRSFVITLVTVVVIAGFLFFVIRRLLDRPVRALVEGTEAVAHMDLDRPIAVHSSTELETLATSFNVMQARLREARAANDAFLEQLEQKVDDRSRELAATQEKLVQSDRLASLGQLAASVAHEVNNPISAVLNLSVFLQRVLTDDGVPLDRLPAFRRHLRQISDETTRAGRIVTDLLTFSRRAAPRRQPADLNAVVHDALALVGHRIELAGIQVTTDLAPDLPLVPCDRAHIHQVLINLALNAVEALQGRGHIRIRTDTDRATRQVVIDVADDGPGIPKDCIHRIFDPFFTTKLGEKGVGLGLAVAYGIVEAHGGRLSVRSAVGRETVFTIRLPLDGVQQEEGPSA